jgi:muconate cycloisomerase
MRAVRVERFEVLVIDVPMRVTVEHAMARRETARNVLVALHGGGLTGWGECCPRPYVTGETVEGAVEALEQRILPRVAALEPDSFPAAAEALAVELEGLPRDEHAAFCAAELAFLDLCGQHFDASAGSVLGPVVARDAAYSGILATTDPRRAGKACCYMRLFGVGAVKVKVDRDLDRNLALLRIARRRLGKKCSLRVDVNGDWDADEAVRQLEAMRPFALEAVEQPCPPADLDAMAHVTAAGVVPVVADESLCSADDARTLIERRACDIFNIRIAKNGGLINAGRLEALAKKNGLRCQLGALVGETGILSAAGRHFATRRDGLLWCEGSYGSLLLKETIMAPDLTLRRGARGPALEGTGLGVAPLPERLERYRCR